MSVSLPAGTLGWGSGPFPKIKGPLNNRSGHYAFEQGIDTFVFLHHVDVPAYLFYYPHGPQCFLGKMGRPPKRDGPVPPLSMGLLDLHGQLCGIAQMDGKKESLLCPQLHLSLWGPWGICPLQPSMVQEPRYLRAVP